MVVSDPVRRAVFEVRVGRAVRPTVKLVAALGPRPDVRQERSVAGVRVVKTGAETGEVVFGDGGDARRVEIDCKGPLASLRLVGVDGRGRAFVVVERFREPGRLEVEREAVVVERSGRLVARMAIAGAPAVPVLREFFVGGDGALYRMVPGTTTVRFTRFEVRP